MPPTSTTTTLLTGDMQYCHWIARRAVARAALHLGIEHMTDEALGVVADCLLGYLERIGSCTAATAQASQRMTSHCNVLDVVNAVEMCTSSTVTASGDTDEDDEGGASKRPEYPVESYKSLAVFCFGPNWDQPGDAERNQQQMLVGRRRADSKGLGGGGGSGWNVPFPEEIPDFPLRNDPKRPEDVVLHASALESKRKSIDGAAKVDEDKVEPISLEDVPTSFWGAASAADSKDDDAPLDSKPAATTDQPPAKKLKTSATISSSEENDIFLPTFYPPIPRNILHTQKSSMFSTVLAPAEAPVSDTPAVRTALAVPVGRTSGETSTNAIQPVSRASGSRVSRILEGSMEPGA